MLKEETGELLLEYLSSVVGFSFQTSDAAATHGDKKGGGKLVKINFESPLYFDCPQHNPLFTFEDLPFPSFTEKSLQDNYNRHYEARSKDFRGVLVANNKYRGHFKRFYPLNFAKFKALLRNNRQQWRLYGNFERRDLAIAELSKLFDLDVYGNDWHLLKRTNANFNGRCHSKFKVLQGYDFSICYENIDWPNYFTEKVPQSILMGALPIVTPHQKITMRMPHRELVVTLEEFIGDPRGCLSKFHEKLLKPTTYEYLSTHTFESVKAQIERKLNG